MNTRKESIPKDGGFGWRLTYAIFMTIALIPFIVCAALFFVLANSEGGGSEAYLVAYIFIGLAAFFALQAVVAYIATFKGVTHKWANKLLIVFSALLCPALIGIVPVIGGAYGIRDINDPQRAEERRSKPKTGFALRLTAAILLATGAIGLIIGSTLMYTFAHRNSFMHWFELTYNTVTIENDDSVELVSDKQYDNWEVISVSSSYGTVAEVTIRYPGGYDRYYFASENASEKTVTFKNDNGETLKLSYANWQKYSQFIENDGWDIEGSDIVFMVLVICAISTTLLAILQFVGTFAGRKRAWGNVLCIVIGAITSPTIIGILGLIGGIRGYRHLKPAKPKQLLNEQSNENEVLSVSDESTASLTEQPVPTADPDTYEYIQPKLSLKAKKAMMITMIVSYSLLLIAGILFASVEAISPLFKNIGICEEISARAYGIVIGMMMLVGIPSIGYYFATIAPLELSKKTKILLAAISTVLTLALMAAAYVVIYVAEIDGLTVNYYLEGSDTWFVPLSLAFAPLGLMVCYLLTLFRINPSKIRTNKPEECGDGLAAVIKHVFALIVYGIMRLVKGILSFKEKQPEIFILVATVLLTWLAFFTAFIFAIICIVVLVGVVVMYFTGVMSMAYSGNNGAVATEKVYKDEYGNKTTVEEQPYVVNDRYEKVYKDKYGGEYVSDDGGKTVVKKTDDE